MKNDHTVVVTNPPYIGRRCLSREIKTALKEQYPKSSTDLSAAFLERCLKMLDANGRLGIITQSSIMSIPSYKNLRDYLLNDFYMRGAINCGPGVFPLASGEKIDSILLLVDENIILSQENAKGKTCFIDLTGSKDKCENLETALNSPFLDHYALKEGSVRFFDQTDFTYGIPNNLFLQLSSTFFKKLNKLPKLGDIAEIRQGLATTDNGRFVRYHFDVDDDLKGSTWVPYIKGSGSQRYASDNPFLVKWANNGQEIKEAVAEAYPYLKG